MTLIANELSDARTHMEGEILDQTCTILEVNRVSDEMGGFTESDGTIAVSVACRLGINKKAGVAGAQAGRVVYADALFLDVPSAQSLSEGNRVVIGSITYEVVWVEDAVQWQMLKSAHVKVA